MKPREVHLEHLLSREVHDQQGRAIGRIEEVEAVRRGRDLVVTAYLIGAWGWRERLGLRHLWGHRGFRGYRARWDQVDVSDPRHPVLTCARSLLELHR